MKIKCFLFGHKPAPYTDSGYEICERCKMHSFYDNPHCCDGAKWPYYYSDAVLLRPYLRIRFMIVSAIAQYSYKNRCISCDYCGEKSKAKEWHGDTCPKCNEVNLPF